MKKYIKNLATIDRVLQFEMDQLRLKFSQLQSEVDRISNERIQLREGRQQERAQIIDTPDLSMTFNAYEQWAEKTYTDMGEKLKDLDEKIEELHTYLMEKFQDTKKISHTLGAAKSELISMEKKNEQKVLDQLGELRFHLRNLKDKR